MFFVHALSRELFNGFSRNLQCRCNRRSWYFNNIIRIFILQNSRWRPFFLLIMANWVINKKLQNYFIFIIIPRLYLWQLTNKILNIYIWLYWFSRMWIMFSLLYYYNSNIEFIVHFIKRLVWNESVDICRLLIYIVWLVKAEMFKSHHKSQYFEIQIWTETYPCPIVEFKFIDATPMKWTKMMCVLWIKN